MEKPSETPSNVQTPAPTGEPTATNETPAPQKMSPAGRAALNVLMDREAQVRQQEQALKKQAAEIARQREEFERAQKPGNPDPTEIVNKEIETLRQKIQAFEARESETRQATLIEEEKARVRSALAEKDDYKAIQAVNGYDTVFETMLSHYNQTGTWLTEEEAAQKVIPGLRQLYEQLTPVFGKQQSAPNPQSHESPAEAYNTLNSRMTSEAPTHSQPAVKSNADVLKEAARLLRFKTS